MVRSRGFLIGAIGLLDAFNMINSTANSYEKELKNTNLKEFNSSLLVDTGLSIISKKH